MSARRRAVGRHVGAVAWLTAVWVLLWGDLSAANVLGGVVVGSLVLGLTPMPPLDFHGRLHVPSLLRLAGRFVVDLVVASVGVAALALDPRRRPRSAVLGVRLRNHSDLYLTLTAQLCSLVPGSIVVEAHRITGTLYIHVLDVTTSGTDAARRHVLDTEARLMRAIASDEELAAAGLTRRPGRDALPATGGGGAP